jgi:hypothetical protein
MYCVLPQRKEFYQSQRAIIRKKIDSEAVSFEAFVTLRYGWPRDTSSIRRVGNLLLVLPPQCLQLYAWFLC